jgi:hypothetical protein
MRRRVMTVVTVVSAVVCVGSLLLVGRSMLRWDLVAMPLGDEQACGAYTSAGRLVLWHASYHQRLAHGSGSGSSGRPELEWFWEHEVRGVRWMGIGWGPFNGLQVLVGPLWPVAMVTAILPVWWWGRRRREGRRGFEVRMETNGYD